MQSMEDRIKVDYFKETAAAFDKQGRRVDGAVLIKCCNLAMDEDGLPCREHWIEDASTTEVKIPAPLSQ